MKEYDLYVPLHYNNGTPIESEKISRLKRQLVERFGGLTHFPQSNEGLWKIGRVTFRDKIIILRALVDEEEDQTAVHFFQTLKAEMQREWQQESVLIVMRKVTTV